MLMPHARFPLPAQDGVKTSSIIRVFPQKVLREVVVHIGESTGSRTNLNTVVWTRVSLSASAHRTRLNSSVAEFRDPKRHLTIKHAETIAEIIKGLCVLIQSPAKEISWLIWLVSSSN